MTQILDEVTKILAQREREDYGPAKIMFDLIGMFWTEYTETTITAQDVALMMALFKIARCIRKPKRDNLIDAIGYLVLASELED